MHTFKPIFFFRPHCPDQPLISPEHKAEHALQSLQVAAVELFFWQKTTFYW